LHALFIRQQILDHVDKLRTAGSTVTRLSVTGYSLGGLIARYVLGILYQRKFFDSVRPVNFTTFATPHVGLPMYDSFRSKMFRSLGPRLLSRTGAQFYAVDKWSPRGRPLLQVMADPGKSCLLTFSCSTAMSDERHTDQIFYKALLLFPHLTIFANAVNDITVPYVTSAIESSDPFISHNTSGLTPVFDPVYKPVITSYTIPPTPPPKEVVPLTSRVKKVLLAPNPGPPFLSFGFPGNLIMWASFPFWLPAIFTLAFVRLSTSARSSRSRIALLEADASFSSRLIHAVAHMERDLEAAVVDMADQPSDERLRDAVQDPGSRFTSGTSTPGTEAAAGMAVSAMTLADTSALAATDPLASLSKLPSSSASLSKSKKSQAKASKSLDPILLPVQLEMVENLNKLPDLKKRLVFIDPVMNSHATIVARDVKRFAWHQQGWGVIQCWADGFVL
jgi:hypothetical protein